MQRFVVRTIGQRSHPRYGCQPHRGGRSKSYRPTTGVHGWKSCCQYVMKEDITRPPSSNVRRVDVETFNMQAAKRAAERFKLKLSSIRSSRNLRQDQTGFVATCEGARLSLDLAQMGVDQT